MIDLIERSVSAAELLIFIVVIRALLLHRLPKITFQIMWAVVILRLLLPYSVEVPAGIPQLFSAHLQLSETGPQNTALQAQPRNTAPQAGGALLQNAASVAAGAHPHTASGDNSARLQGNPAPEGTAAAASGGNDILPVQRGYGTSAEHTEVSKELLPGGSRMAGFTALKAGAAGWLKANSSLLRACWLTGTVLCLLYFAVSHLRSRRLYAQAIPVDASVLPVTQKRRIRVRVSDRILTPFTYGILFPVILLPKITDWNDRTQLRMILEHEAVHVRRFDVLYKWLMAAAVCIHWFNPLVWVMYILAGRDMELSCDEAVVKRFENGNRADYALALLNFEEKRSLSPMFTRFSGNAVKERIEAIMKLNKTSILSSALAAILVAGATTVFAAPREDRQAPSPTPAPAASGKNTAQNDEDETKYLYPENGGSHKKEVIQYLCEASYYTAEEFEELMEEERKSIEDDVKTGTLTRKAADEMLKQIDQTVEDVRNGKKVQSPSPVFYPDGTPVVNSKGEQLYAKASDIERMNAQLRCKAEMEAAAAAETTVEFEDVLMDDFPEDFENTFLESGQKNGHSGILAITQTEFSWYTCEEYQEYAEQMKKEYAAMLGEWGFNSTDGWYEWTEEVIAEACAQLDKTLQFIKDGGMISKPSESSGEVLMMGYTPGVVLTAADDSFESTEGFPDYGNTDAAIDDTLSMTEATSTEGGEWDDGYLKAYEPYGVTADQKAQYYLFNGKPIAGFCDHGFATLVDGAAKEDGGVYVKVVRDNDAIREIIEISAEEFSKLTGLKCN